jgi:hypothetical protein
MKSQSNEQAAVARAAARGAKAAAEPRGATLDVVTGANITAEDIKAMVEARVKAAIDKARQKEEPEVVEPRNWWGCYSSGPYQILNLNGPLAAHQVIKLGESAFVTSVMVLNDTLVIDGGSLTAGHLLASFSLPYEVKYQTGNLTAWTLGEPSMNVTLTGSTLVPGQMVYTDGIGFTPSQPGLYEMNISYRLLGATPTYINAPQFAGFCRWVEDFDDEFAPFVTPTPGFQFDFPIRFQVYP